MKKLLIALVLFSTPFMPMTSFGSDHLCKKHVDKELAPTNKIEVLDNVAGDESQNTTELEDVEWKWVIHLLKKNSSETYTHFDASDAGYHVVIVSRIDCSTLWDGFVFNW